MGLCYFYVSCESGFSGYMAGPGICILCLADTCAPGFFSTLPAFMRSSSSHPAGPHGRPAQTTINLSPIAGAVCNRCDSSTACRLCCLEPRLRRSSLLLVPVVLECQICIC